MSDSFLPLYDLEADLRNGDGPLTGLATREEIFRALDTFKQVDLVIVGGGLSGMTLARAAALQGSDVLLVEPGYFGERCGSWRDFIASTLTRRPTDVVSALRSLQVAMTEVAPHLATTRVWSDEVAKGFFVRVSSWFAQRSWRVLGAGGAETIVPDMDERALVRETALAARQEGALVLSAATATYIERDAQDGGFRVGVKDLLAERQVEIKTTALYIDSTFSHSVASRMGTPIIKRSVSHPASVAVVLSVKYVGPGADQLSQYRTVALRDGSLGSVYQFAPGLVEVCVQDDSQESDRVTQRAQEVCEWCGYSIVNEVSRRAVGRSFDARSRVSSFRGALLSEERVPWEIFSVASKILSKVPSCGTVRRGRRPLPGEWRGDERERFIAAGRAAGVSDITIASVLARWQGRVRYIPLMENGFTEVCPGILNGEISLAVWSDQVSSVEDLLFGSLALHTVPGWRELVPTLTQALSDQQHRICGGAGVALPL